MNYKIITPITNEPVTLTEAKAHLRLTTGIDGDDAENSLVQALIIAAREYCENVTGRALAEQTVEMYLNEFPNSYEIELARPPLISVTSVKYTDSNGTETTMTENTDYITDADSNIGRIVLPYGITWPTATLYTVNPIKIRYTCGYSQSNPIPKSIKQAMLLLIGHWYENREATGQTNPQIKFAVKVLLSQYKVWWL